MTSQERNQKRLMIGLPPELREQISRIAKETTFSQSRVAAELIARALGQSLFKLPDEREAR